MKKERDYHRLHHNRVAQEKNRLINDLKRLKAHYETYEPLLKTIKDKYDGAVRDKVLNQLERDRAVAELKSIKENEIQQQSGDNLVSSSSNLLTANNNNGEQQGPTQKRLEQYRSYEKNLREQQLKSKNGSDDDQFNARDSEFPAETGLNPYLNKLKDEGHNINSLRLSQTIQAHNLPISSLVSAFLK